MFLPEQHEHDNHSKKLNDLDKIAISVMKEIGISDGFLKESFDLSASGIYKIARNQSLGFKPMSFCLAAVKSIYLQENSVITYNRDNNRNNNRDNIVDNRDDAVTKSLSLYSSLPDVVQEKVLTGIYKDIIEPIKSLVKENTNLSAYVNAWEGAFDRSLWNGLLRNFYKSDTLNVILNKSLENYFVSDLPGIAGNELLLKNTSGLDVFSSYQRVDFDRMRKDCYSFRGRNITHIADNISKNIINRIINGGLSSSYEKEKLAGNLLDNLLTSREASIIKSFVVDRNSLDDIAAHYSVSRELIRSVKDKALMKIKARSQNSVPGILITSAEARSLYKGL